MADPDVKAVLTSDHAELYDPDVARRYFAKFGRITGHLPRVAAELEREGPAFPVALHVAQKRVAAG